MHSTKQTEIRNVGFSHPQFLLWILYLHYQAILTFTFNCLQYAMMDEESQVYYTEGDIRGTVPHHCRVSSQLRSDLEDCTFHGLGYEYALPHVTCVYPMSCTTGLPLHVCKLQQVIPTGGWNGLRTRL